MKRFNWVLGSRAFTFLISTRFLVGFSTQIQAVAVGWIIYQIKQDPLYLGLIGLTEAMPALGLALFAGYIVDRSRPLTVYRRAISCSALSALILFSVTGPFFTGMAPTSRVTFIFMASFMTGVARAFLGPAQFSILPLTVPRESLGQATAWSTSLMQAAALSGPALGGLLVALGGGQTFFLIFFLLASAIFTSTQVGVGNERRPAEPLPATSSAVRAPGRGAILKNLLSGVSFVFANQILLGALALDMFAVLFGGATALFPVFARDIFQNGPVGLGMLRAAMPVGSFCMGYFLTRVPISRFSGRIMLIAFCGFGICMTAFGLSKSFMLSVVLLFVTGMCDSISMVVRQTILQLSTPPEMRGRVASVSAIFIGSSNEIGAFESGLAAKLMGTRPSVIFGGCMTLVVVAITWFRAPRLRKVHLSKL